MASPSPLSEPPLPRPIRRLYFQLHPWSKVLIQTQLYPYTYSYTKLATTEVEPNSNSDPSRTLTLTPFLPQFLLIPFPLSSPALSLTYSNHTSPCYLIGAGGGTEEASSARVRCAWEKFRELAPILIRGASLKVKGIVYRAYIQIVLGYVRQTWFMKEEDMARVKRM